MENLKQESERTTDITAHLYLVKSILSVIAAMGTESPDAFENGDVQRAHSTGDWCDSGAFKPASESHRALKTGEPIPCIG